MFAGVIGVGLYPLMGTRVWCRYGCPMAALLGLAQKLGRFRIRVKKDMCIACGNCSTYCEMGIDVRQYAMANQSFTRASCVGCGMCAHVCPRGVLKLENRARRWKRAGRSGCARSTCELGRAGRLAGAFGRPIRLAPRAAAARSRAGTGRAPRGRRAASARRRAPAACRRRASRRPPGSRSRVPRAARRRAPASPRSAAGRSAPAAGRGRRAWRTRARRRASARGRGRAEAPPPWRAAGWCAGATWWASAPKAMRPAKMLPQYTEAASPAACGDMPRDSVSSV